MNVSCIHLAIQDVQYLSGLRLLRMPLLLMQGKCSWFEGGGDSNIPVEEGSIQGHAVKLYNPD